MTTGELLPQNSFSQYGPALSFVFLQALMFPRFGAKVYQTLRRGSAGSSSAKLSLGRPSHFQGRVLLNRSNAAKIASALLALGASYLYLGGDKRAHADATQSVTTSKGSAGSGALRLSSEMLDNMRIFSGRANPELAADIAAALGAPLGKISVRGFSDGEIGIQVEENVRGKDVYIIQPTCPPGVNDNLVELLLLISTMRRASANTITAIIPYYGYARQDRKMASRVPISAADVAQLLMSMGVDRVVGVDLHCGQIQGFFSPRTPCDNLEANIIALPFVKSMGLGSETTVISPDAGGVYRAKKFRESLKRVGVEAGLAMIIKQRVKANDVEKMDLVGSVEGSDAIIVDDMIDTAGTLVKAAQELKDRGAKRVFAFATHGVFSGPAYERIQESALEKVFVSNSIPLTKDPRRPVEKIAVVSLAPMLADAIARIQGHESVSALFDITAATKAT